MKSFTALVLALFSLASVHGFSVTSSFAGSSVGVQYSNAAGMTMEYIRKSSKMIVETVSLASDTTKFRSRPPPVCLGAASGMTKEQYRQLKEKERNANKGKNLGKVGITTFKSRSFADWQKSGGKNLFPVDPTKVKDPREIPYM